MLVGEGVTIAPPGEGESRESSGKYPHQRQAIIALAADGLDGGRCDVGHSCYPFVKLTDTLHTDVLAAAVNHCTFTDDVIHNDEAAGAGQLERPLEVGRSIDLIGINEDQIERGARITG